VNVAGRYVSIGAVVGFVGGILALIGAFIAWETISSPIVNLSTTGWDIGNGGKIITFLGIVAIAVALAWILALRLPMPGVILIVVGVLVALVGIANYFSVTDDVNAGNALLPGSTSLGIGVYVDILAGVVIAIGGVLGLVSRKS